MRIDTLRACRMHKNKRYVDKETFKELSPVDRIEALLWLVWPRTLTHNVLLRIANTPNGGFYTGALLSQNRIVRVSRGTYRFKPCI